jgi:hypothetical protein
MMDSEVYKIECGVCDETVQLPARDGQAHCPNCGAPMQLEWHGGRVDFDRSTSEREERMPTL